MSIGKLMAILTFQAHINVKSLFYLLFNPEIIKLLKIFQVGVGGRPGRGAMPPAPPLATALPSIVISILSR